MKEKTIPLIFGLPEILKEEVENIAKKRSVSQAAICRIALSKFLEAENATKMD